jgi:hypothetical protein
MSLGWAGVRGKGKKGVWGRLDQRGNRADDDALTWSLDMLGMSGIHEEGWGIIFLLLIFHT